MKISVIQLITRLTEMIRMKQLKHRFEPILEVILCLIPMSILIGGNSSQEFHLQILRDSMQEVHNGLLTGKYTVYCRLYMTQTSLSSTKDMDLWLHKRHNYQMGCLH